MTSYNFKRKSDESIEQYHIRLFDDMNIHEASSEELAHYLNLEYGSNYSESKWRKDYSQYRKWKEFIDSSNSTDVSEYKYKETTEIFKDGSQNSDKLIKMSENQSKSPEYLLKAHGFDVNEWEITNARNSIWNSGVDNTLYSSKITVKPLTSGFNVEKFVELIKNIKPKHIKQPLESTDRLLTIPFVDLHFGINSLLDYQNKVDETFEIIDSKIWDTIYLQIGNDALHVNNHKNQTANGTQIEGVDLDKATEELYKFYVPILEKSLEKSKNVVVDYVPGNHDSDITWMFVKMLAKQYPQIKWNTEIEAKKMFKWNNIFICGVHGEKGLARITKALITEYRDYMVGAKTVEIYSGHLHSERVKDEFGILVRTLPTSAKVDSWHKSQTFEGSVKASQLFEYDKDKLKVIHYV